MFEHKETLGYLCARLARLLSNQLREGLTPLGLLPAQFTALAEISAAEGLTQKQLVERLGLEQPGVARTLSGLEAMGWIERRPAKSGRSPGLHLTERARATLPRAAEIAAAIDRRASAELTRTERAQLLDQLAGLSAANLRE
ncbi:MAG: MarR family winged helix-turn-helix transcriptional regulator [Devosia sp.]